MGFLGAKERIRIPINSKQSSPIEINLCQKSPQKGEKLMR